MSTQAFSLKPKKLQDYDGETSGIGSMATTYLSPPSTTMGSFASAPSTGHKLTGKQLSRIYQKARELSTAHLKPQQNKNDQLYQVKLVYKPHDNVPITANFQGQPTLKEFKKKTGISSKSRRR